MAESTREVVTMEEAKEHGHAQANGAQGGSVRDASDATGSYEGVMESKESKEPLGLKTTTGGGGGLPMELLQQYNAWVVSNPAAAKRFEDVARTVSYLIPVGGEQQVALLPFIFICFSSSSSSSSFFYPRLVSMRCHASSASSRYAAPLCCPPLCLLEPGVARFKKKRREKERKRERKKERKKERKNQTRQ